MMLLIRRNFLLSTVNGFIAKNVLRFIQIFVHIHVWIHVIHALHKECVWVSQEKRTCSDCFKFCRSPACFDHHKKSRKFRGVTFRQNATRRLDVKHVQLLSNVNEETFIAVVNMYVGFVKNMCCLTICATCNLKRLRHQVTNLFFTTLRLNSSLRGTML